MFCDVGRSLSRTSCRQRLGATGRLTMLQSTNRATGLPVYRSAQAP